MVKYFEDLNEEEIRLEMSIIARKQLKHLCDSISNINNLLDTDDCLMYLNKKIKCDKIKSRKNLYVWTKHKLHDLYRKEKNDLRIKTDFTNWYCFISDSFYLDDEKISCILISINAKFKKFLDVEKFLTGKERKINYYKIKKVYASIIEETGIICDPNRKSIISYFNNLNDEFKIREKTVFLEYKEYEDYNDFNLLDSEVNYKE